MRSPKRTSRPKVPRLTQIWRAALTLGEAWWEFGDEEHKEQYRNAGRNDGLLSFLDRYLHDDLIYLLSHGDLVALGVQVSPQAGPGPETIPSFMFHHSEVDWDRSGVKGYGRSYDGVKVVRPEDVHRTRRSTTKRQVRRSETRPIADTSIPISRASVICRGSISRQQAVTGQRRRTCCGGSIITTTARNMPTR